MFYLIPTKNGLGIELWGTYDDIRTVYSVIANFWNQEDYITKKGFANRDQLISGFSYEIRKAYEESRLKRKNSHFSNESCNLFGCEISWVHFLFSITALRFNMKYIESNKLEIATFLQLEYWLEKAMIDYDKNGGNELKNYISGAIYAGNENMYQYMRTINAEHFRLGGGKKAFRNLPSLLNKSVYNTKEYREYLKILEQEAVRLKCDIADLEIDDNDIDYENIKL